MNFWLSPLPVQVGWEMWKSTRPLSHVGTASAPAALACMYIGSCLGIHTKSNKHFATFLDG